MLTDTQISSFIVPQNIWTNGYAGRSDLPPLVLPVRDALDIERRALKDVNIRNEIRRYTLCCERIQGIVRELSLAEGLLPSPVVWPPSRVSSADLPCALSYLALAEALGRRLRNSPYSRVTAIFFPPEHAQIHFQVFEAICRHPDIEQLLGHAAQYPPRDIAKVTPSECRRALDQRCSLLKRAASELYGLVDVIELL